MLNLEMQAPKHRCQNPYQVRSPPAHAPKKCIRLIMNHNSCNLCEILIQLVLKNGLLQALLSHICSAAVSGTKTCSFGVLSCTSLEDNGWLRWQHRLVKDRLSRKHG